MSTSLCGPSLSPPSPAALHCFSYPKISIPLAGLVTPGLSPMCPKSLTPHQRAVPVAPLLAQSTLQGRRTIPPSTFSEEGTRHEGGKKSLADSGGLRWFVVFTDQTRIFTLPGFEQFLLLPTHHTQRRGAELHMSTTTSSQCSSHSRPGPPHSRALTPGCSCAPAQGEGMRR